MRLAMILFVLADCAMAFAAPMPAFDDAPLRAIQFIDKNEGWSVGDDGVIWHSIDGGKNWERQKSGTRASLRSVHFATPYTGWVAGRVEKAGDAASMGVLLHTTDGGITWAETATNLLPGLNIVRFFDEKNGIVIGDGCPGYPAGTFTTNDGGGSWRPVSGPRIATWLACDFHDNKSGLIAGAWSQSAKFVDGPLQPGQMEIPGSRSVRAVRISGKEAIVAGDGGLVMINRDWPNGTWSHVELPLDRDARSVCDFHSVAAVDQNLWLVGRPGSVVLFSPDFGRTWEVRKTIVSVPLHAIAMLDANTGWAVGELGTILGTIDGGKTWTSRKSGGHRAAILAVHASGKGIPYGTIAQLAGKDGYLAAAVQVTSADAKTADPKHATNEFSLSQAMRSVSGATAETLWSFPVPGHANGLSAQQLLAFWHGLHDGKANEQLLRQLVMTIRVWRPEVILTDSIAASAPAAGQLVLATMQEAFKRAADATMYPEQLSVLGLNVHATQKLYAISDTDAHAQVILDDTAFVDALADTPNEIAKSAQKLMACDASDRTGYRLISHRKDGSEADKDLMTGTTLARGGLARRAESNRGYTPEFIASRRNAMESRTAFAKAAERLAKVDADFTSEWKTLKDRLAVMPDAEAADALVAMGERLADAGRWSHARESFAYASEKYPLQARSEDAYRWLVRFHSSGEAVRRMELGHFPALRATEFVELPNVKGLEPELIPVGFTEPLTQKTRWKFRTAEAEAAWVMAGTDLESRMFAMNPLASREPDIALGFHASRLKLGFNADANRALKVYHRTMIGQTIVPGENPWFDAVASELWLANRGAAATPVKPMAMCEKIATRPILDGKLDDACWKNIAPFAIRSVSTELASTHGTEARFAFDDEFLYVGVTCENPTGEVTPNPETRRRDEDLSANDRVEILLDTDRDYRSYFRLCVDRRGCAAEDCTGDKTWNPKWFVTVEPNAKGWTAEIAIPLSELTGRLPRRGHHWAMNAVRVIPGKGILAWNAPADSTPRTEGMGLMEFHIE